MTDAVQCTPQCISGNNNEDSVGIIVTGRQTAPLEEARNLLTSDAILESVTQDMDNIIEEVISETGISLSAGLLKLLENQM